MDGDRAKDSDERGVTFLATSGSRAGGMMKEKTAHDAPRDLRGRRSTCCSPARASRRSRRRSRSAGMS